MEYGFKSIKSIVRFSFADQQPKTFWEGLQRPSTASGQRQSGSAASRWSQATEEDITTRIAARR